MFIDDFNKIQFLQVGFLVVESYSYAFNGLDICNSRREALNIVTDGILCCD